MKQENIIDALNWLDEELIEEVGELRKKEETQIRTMKFNWRRWGAIAACVCLVVVGIKLWPILGYISGGNADTASCEESATTEAVSDMIAFFIYQGNTYEQYEVVEAENLKGAYVGTSNGDINEWSEAEAYVESAGSISGDFYEVNGFSPEFMLCMEQEDGSISTYVNSDGLVLETGADLFEDCIHLAGNYQEVLYQTRADWYYSTGEPEVIPEEYEENISQFVGALNEGEIVAMASYPLEAGSNNIYDREIYHMFFELENGITIHLRLFEHGYVAFRGIQDQLVQVEEQSFNEIIQVLEEVQE